jgi:hypothetical protein
MAAPGKWKFYEYAKLYLPNGTHDIDDTTLGYSMALFLSTSNCNTLSVGTGVYGDLTNEHANANGYTTGGIALTGESWTRSGGTSTFTASPVVWTASGGSIINRFAVVYVNATVNTIVKPLLCVSLLDTAPADITTTNGNTLTVTMHASGAFTLSGADVD